MEITIIGHGNLRKPLTLSSKQGTTEAQLKVIKQIASHYNYDFSCHSEDYESVKGPIGFLHYDTTGLLNYFRIARSGRILKQIIC